MDTHQSSLSSKEKYNSIYSISPISQVRRKKFNKNHLTFGFEYETLPLFSEKITQLFEIYQRTEFSQLHQFGVDASNYEDARIKIYWNQLSIQLNKFYFAMYKTPASQRTKSKMPFYMPYANTDIDIHKQWHLEYDASVRGDLIYKSFIDRYVNKSEFTDIRHFANKTDGQFLEIISPAMKYSYITKNKFSDIMTRVLPVDGHVEYWNNPNTSTHVHVSFPELQSVHTRPLVMVKLLYAWLYFEPIFLLLCGHWRRNNTYCRNYRSRFNSIEGYKLFSCPIDDSNYMDFIKICYPEIYTMLQEYNKPEITIETYHSEIIIALLTIIQGGSEYLIRYVSLNMLNLLPNGIGTIEFRIKQGSNDVEENKMFMLLLGEFVESVMNLKNKQKEPTLISSIYKDTSIQKSIWQLYTIISQSKYDWENNTSITFENTVSPRQKHSGSSDSRDSQESQKTDKEIVTDVFNLFFTYIKNDEVKNYWGKVANSLYNLDLMSGGAVQIAGGRDIVAQVHTNASVNRRLYKKIHAKKAFERKNKEPMGERESYMSSFGLVDYGALNKSINKKHYKAYYDAYKKHK